MALINIQKLDFKLTDQQIASLKSFFLTHWFGVPRWLRVVVFGSVIIGGLYFLYNRLVTASNVDDIRHDLKELNEKANKNIVMDRYVFDVGNVVTSVRTLQQEIDALYDYEELYIEEIEGHLAEMHPESEFYKKLQRLSKELELTRTAYRKIIIHHLDMYNQFPKANPNQGSDLPTTNESSFQEKENADE